MLYIMRYDAIPPIKLTFNKFAAETELTWPVFPCRIEPTPPSPIPESYEASPAQAWLGPAASEIIVATGFPPASPQLAEYDPLSESAQLGLIRDASVVDTSEDHAILGFVNRWGLLGEADPELEHWCDSLFLTRRALDRFQRLARWKAAMDQGRWSADEVPTITEVCAMLEGVSHTQLTWRQKRRATAQVFAFELTAALRGRTLAPLLLPSGARGAGVDRRLQPRSLGDVLLLALWDRVGSEEILRRCKGCGAIFGASRTNTRRLYCDYDCQNRSRQRRYRQKIRRRSRQRP